METRIKDANIFLNSCRNVILAIFSICVLPFNSHASSVSGYIIYSKPSKPEVDSSTYGNISGEYSFEHSSSLSSSISADLDYTHVWATYQDESNSYVEAMTFSGLQTRDFSKSSKNKSVLALNSVSYGLSFNPPVNKGDKTAGFRGSMSIPLSIAGQLYSNSWSLSSEPTFYSYEYDTADVSGTSYNRKWSADLTSRLTFRIIEKLTWRNSLRYLTYTNTIDRTYQIYAASTGLAFQWTANIGTSATIYTSDRVVTERRFLDDDTTSFRLGLEWRL